MPDMQLPISPSSSPTPSQEIEKEPVDAPASGAPFRNTLAEFVYTRTYSRWLEDEQRRETWDETVDRYVSFIVKHRPGVPEDVIEDIRSAILRMEVMPSMRALWSAGSAAERDNTCFYNCSFVPLDSFRAFSEMLYILMMGTGVGYSVESQFVDKLPKVAPVSGKTIDYEIPDSTVGWADAVYFGMTQWFQGHKVNFDYSKIRPKGAILKTKGGRASGPEPLIRLMEFAEKTILAAAGRKLKPIEAHDIGCMIGEIVMVGGVRRAALISISDLDDEEMRHAKDWSRGEFPQIRYMANNSAYYDERPDEETFWAEWDALKASMSGERGLSIDSWHRRADRPRGQVRTNPCLTGDTRVMTESGLVQIGDLVHVDTKEGSGGYKVAIDRRFNEGVWAAADTSSGVAFKSGTKEVFTLKTQEGYQLRLTADHRVMTVDGWKEAGQLQPGDRIHIANTEGMFGSRGNADVGMLGGWITGDGTLLAEDNNAPRLYFYGDDHHLIPMMLDAVERLTGQRPNVPHREENDRKHFECAALREYLGQIIANKFRVPEFVWQGTEDCQRSYLSALFSADGGVQGTRNKGVSVRLSSSKLDLLHDVQTLLLNFGIASKVYEERRSAGYRDLPDGNGGYKSYLCEAEHELVISKGNLVRFHEHIGFIHEQKQGQLSEEIDSRMALVGVKGASGRKGRGFYRESFTARFESLVPDGTEDVYDMTVPVTHSFVANGVVVHNCGEIGLRFQRSSDPVTGAGGSGQFCNLSAAVMRSHDTKESFSEKVRIATWIGIIQSTFTHFPYLRPGWEQVCKEDQLLGVDITGQCDNPELTFDPEIMSHFNSVAVKTAAEAAAIMNINMPVAITCGKPSGNSSQLLDCASGFHPRYARYYLRRVRIASTDPLFHLARDTGLPIYKEVQFRDWDDDEVPTWVVEFPVEAPEGAVLRDDERALDQCNRYLNIMKSWCSNRGHNQSATIYVREDEWEDVGRWVYENFNDITGLSFLPYDAGKYELAPYEEITEEQYEAAVAAMPDVDFGLLSYYEQEDRGQGSVELACVGGSCEIDYDQLVEKDDAEIDFPEINALGAGPGEAK